MVTAVMASTASSKSSRRLLSLVFLLSPLLVSASDWKITPGITLAERYSDNINLAANGLEQSDWITEVTPRISVTREGARLKVQADYSLQGLLYADNSTLSRFHHYLNGRATAELIEDWFFLDANARITQVLKQGATPGSYGAGSLAGIGNTSSVSAYSLSPYLKHRFGSFATVEARISQDGVYSGDSAQSDSQTTRYRLSAVSGSGVYPLSWSATYDKADTSNSAGLAASGSEHAAVSARYALNRKFGLTAQAGMDKHDYTGVTNTLRDYSYYGLGVFYTPSRYFSFDALYNHSDTGNFLSGSATFNPTPRTAIKASSSQRAYGRSYALDLSHRTRQSSWSLRYQDELTTMQQQFMSYVGSVFVYSCPTGMEYKLPGVPPSDPVNCVPLGTVNFFNPTQLNNTYLSKSLIGTVSFTQRRSTWLLSVFDNRREYQNLGAGTDQTRGLQASWTLKPAAHTSFTLSGGMSKLDSTGAAGRQDDLWNVALIATRQFNPKTSGSVELRHQERQSDRANGDYAENSFMARLNMSF